jgi:tRNA U34 5-methylaminomethyl-2-thiouridine-forming methyltransferase MnmC
MTRQKAQISWSDDDLPVSVRFDDPYFSKVDGLAETQHVFLAGNDLPARFKDGFCIAELGFGTGLNFLASLQLWRRTAQPGAFRFTSFEAFPMDVADMARALDVFPDLGDLRSEFLNVWDGPDTPIQMDGAELLVISGDARQTVPQWDSRADAWFLDGFSPAKNPELWEEHLLQSVATHTQPQGTAATYSAAGHVRRSLTAAGFWVERIPGFGRKRHMTIARKTRPA